MLEHGPFGFCAKAVDALERLPMSCRVFIDIVYMSTVPSEPLQTPKQKHSLDVLVAAVFRWLVVDIRTLQHMQTITATQTS